MERKRLLNISLWVVAFLLINIIWANVATNEASKQLNDRGFEFQSERDVSIQAVFGSDADLPISMTTEFVHRDDPSRKANVSWALLDASDNIVASWAGSTNEVVTIEKEVPPGEYTLNTTIEDNIIAMQTLDIAPFAPLATLGHILLSTLLVVVAFGETALRTFIAKKIEDSEIKDDKPREFRKARIGMPEVDGHDDMDESPWREPIVL